MTKQISALVLLIAAAVVPITSRAGNQQYKSVIVTFTKNTIFYDKVLRGQYLVVHDDAAMTIPGKHCTRIYRYDNGQIGALVTTFRCRPVETETATRTSFAAEPSGVNLMRITGFQLTGDNERHGVPPQ